ncbi:hypothetical protein LTS12_005644 [Elasticomyces elasticus]|nr:hypothetical protein LTS12_005644 [Elasticomyces elasticus]
MATQALAISETIRAMKLALRRHQHTSPSSDSSDNDSDTLHTHTNRGHKLRPSSRYAHSGRLDTTGGQARYKRKIVHGGYTRSIINKRPRLYDEDGDAVSAQDVPSDDEVVGEYGEAVEEDPFAGVRLEELLRPLTSASQLAQHSGLRGAYLGTGLSQMAGEAAEMVRRERAALWRGKRLLERFGGDGGFMDCGRFETEGDEELLMPGGVGGEVSGVQSVVEAESNGLGEVEQQQQQRNGDAMEGVEVVDHVESANALGDAAELEAVQEATNAGEPHRPNESTLEHAPTTNGDTTNTTAPTSHSPPPQHPALTDLAQRDDASSNSGTNPSAAPSHRMTTRARARSPQIAASPSPFPSDSASVPTIHPWFHFPTHNLPDRDLGLPAKEAEDTRRLLLLYVQKQENIVRQLSTLGLIGYGGLCGGLVKLRDMWYLTGRVGWLRR